MPHILRDMEMLNRLNHYDLLLFTKVFRQREGGMFIPLTRLVSRSGEGLLHLLVLLVVWQLQLPARVELTALLLLTFAVERCLHWLLKNSLKRPRPQHAFPGLRSLGHAANEFSFPSGHSSRAFLLATVLVISYGAPLLAMYIWASAVALSRVVLGVHFPGDILAGAIIGSSTAVLCASLLTL